MVYTLTHHVTTTLLFPFFGNSKVVLYDGSTYLPNNSYKTK